MIQIRHIVPSLEVRHGGPGLSVPPLAAAQAALGDETELFAPTTGPAASRVQGPLSIHTFPLEWPPQFGASWGLRDALQQTPADIIHHHGLWCRTLHYARKVTQASHARLVISPRGLMSPWAWQHDRARKWFARAFIHPGAFSAAHGWHATSAVEADEIQRLGFKQPVCVAANGVTAPAVDQLIAARTAWHDRCPSLRDRPVALFYSRFHRKKRLQELINLWLSVPRGDWMLLIVGTPDEYSVAQVQSWVEAGGGRGRVLVYDGTTLPQPYAVASIFLLPSHSENFARVVAEAMAAGVAPIVTDSTPWTDLNRVGGGWSVPWHRYPDLLYTALNEGPARLSERGALARSWVLRDFSWAKSARELLEFYRQLQETGR